MSALEIWKYPVPIRDSFTIDMPALAIVLSVATQDGDPYVWAIVDPSNSVESRSFRLYGTGHPVKNQDYFKSKFIGTFLIRDDSLVFHLFEAVATQGVRA